MASKTPKPAPRASRSLGKDHPSAPKNGFPVVAIGASAGGLEAYETLFHALPADTGMAFVLVQHLDPNHHSLLSEILSKATKMPVAEVKSGVKIKPNNVYVIPPDTFMAIQAGTLVLTPRNRKSNLHLSINFFMRSLAEECKGAAIGVVLSGTGSDGTLGLEDIKAEGGITFVQDPGTAEYDGMPRSAVDSGCADFVLPVKEIGLELRRIHKHPYIHLKSEEPGEDSKDDESERASVSLGPEPAYLSVVDQLRRSSGVDFRQYKTGTIQRRALRRAMILKLDSLEQYAQYLREHPEEGLKLYDDVLIPVTSFFRDLEVFESLNKQVYPSIVNAEENDGTIRMWAPGCSTGEETYSLAMTLLEYLGDRASSFQIQIFGTDLNESGIQKARAGVYRESIAEEMSKERLQRFFVKVEGGYRVNKAVRDLCVFARQNLANDPPFSQMNLVACRNLLIYLQPSLQKKIIPILHYALRPSGFLVLGGSESVAAFPNLFSTLDKKNKIYSKKGQTSRLHYDFAHNYHPAAIKREMPRKSAPIVIAKDEFDALAEADRVVLKNHAPVGVVINSAMDVIQFRGETAPFLANSSGKPSLNVLKLARGGLAVELRTLIGLARKKKTQAKKIGIHFDEKGHKRVLNVSVLPFGTRDTEDKDKLHFVILFDDVTSQWALMDTSPGEGGKRRSDHKPDVDRLKRELAEAQDALRSAIESEDSVREEFQSANEEILSANEELQSSNEELETSKEELQSANEELNTLNAELRHKNNELHDLNNDVSNLLNSTRIPLVMLDRGLRIRRVTPMADRLLKVVATDVGRPITDIALNIDVPSLEPAAHRVLETLQPEETEVKDLAGHWHSLTVLPYRTQDNKIDGVVFAMQDIDAIKNASEESRRSSELFHNVINTVIEPLLVLDADLRIVMANSPFYESFHVTPAQTIKRSLYDLGNKQWDIPELRMLLEEVLPKKKVVRNFLVEHTFEDIGRRTMLLNAQTLTALADAQAMILIALEDITDRQQAELARAKLAAIVECSDDAIVGKSLDGIIESWNGAAEQLFGYSAEEAIGQSITLLIPKDRVDEEPVILERVRRGEHIQHYESVRRRKNGTLLDVSLTISPIIDRAGRIVGASKIARNITERKQAEAALIKSEKLAAAGRLAATLAHEINNPLQAVTNIVSLLENSSSLSETERGFARTAETELKRVSHLTQQSLSFYRESVFPVAVDLAASIQVVLELYARIAEKKQIAISMRDSTQGATIHTYPGEVRQIFSTLLLNAMEAVSEQGTISIRIHRRLPGPGLAQAGLRVLIADDGIGIPAQNQKHIFEAFFTTKGEQGTGLGLWVADAIISRLGGSIKVRSSARPGKSGSCFSVFLPAQLPEVRVNDRTSVPVSELASRFSKS